MKSIEKLRDELLVCVTCGARPTIAAMSMYADAIEQELAERYVELPLDADGVPIHVGDVMKWANYDEDLRPAIRTVDGVGEQTFFAWNEEGGKYAQYEAHAYRHHHQPDTWERIIEDAAQFGHDSDVYNIDMEKFVARCKALAGEVDE